MLVDPIQCKIRYIGRTTKKILEHRLIEHISKSRYFNRYYPNTRQNHKVSWINSLLRKGVEPKIKLICIIDDWKESHKLERFLIHKYKKKYDLVNSDDRGEGGFNKVVTLEQKEKISITLKQNYKDGYKHPASKSVDVYDLNANFIQSFSSLNEAARFTKSHVTGVISVLKGKHKQNKGFQFKYSNSSRVIIPVIYNKRDCYWSRKRVVVKNLTTNITIIFNSITECALYFKLPPPSIHQVLNSKNQIYKSRYKVDTYLITRPHKTNLKLESPEVDNQLPIKQIPYNKLTIINVA